jgi:hypothetical protein
VIGKVAGCNENYENGYCYDFGGGVCYIETDYGKMVEVCVSELFDNYIVQGITECYWIGYLEWRDERGLNIKKSGERFNNK